MSAGNDPLAAAVAVIGLSCRLPGAASVEELWRNLCDAVEGITFWSADELAAAGVAASELRDPRYVRAAGALGGVDRFDAALFGLTAREAEVMDPQQRVFLECAWEALDDAGYDPQRFPGWIGVYAGAGVNRYLWMNVARHPEALAAVGAFQAMISNDKDYLPTQASYRLNLRGPSVGVQTACSTSLVAVHLACQGLIAGECDMALAGGVSIGVPERRGYLYQEDGIASPDGHCRPFDARAAGTVRGSGAGLVVLKRLSEARRDGDRVLAVIRGSAINNDGAAKVGYTAPSVSGQAEVIAAAQAVAGVAPETIGYVEAHGTATRLGDPIEVAALSEVFSTAAAGRQGWCALGSIKGNLGHLDAAAGVAGLIKTVLALHHGVLPASLHFECPNPRCELETSAFHVNARTRPWPPGPGPRRAGVSSFGIGGTNAHVVLEEAPGGAVAGSAPESAVTDQAAQEAATSAVTDPTSKDWQLLVLSARSEAALAEMGTRLDGHLQRHPGLELADVAFTLQLGRRALPQRWMVLARDVQEARARLAAGPQRPWTAAAGRQRPAVAFLLSGQGAQAPELGRELYRHAPAFREAIDDSCAGLDPQLRAALLQLLRGPDGAAGPAALRDTGLAQPWLFVFEHALARLWMSLGVEPDFVLGHSVGEYVAACLAGVMEPTAALALVAERGRLMQALTPGAMLAVGLSETALHQHLAEPLELAAVNGPEQCVVSGPEPAIDALAARLAALGRPTRRLRTARAFHSQAVEPMLEPFSRLLAAMDLKEPRLGFVSSLSGRPAAPGELTEPAYWLRQTREPVRFGAALRWLLQEPDRVLLEVGPGHELSRLAGQWQRRRSATAPAAALTTPAETQPAVAANTQPTAAPDSQPAETAELFMPRLVLPGIRSLGLGGAGEIEQLLTTLGRLWLTGAPVDWMGLHRGERRRRTSLPSYPFERRRCWLDGDEEAAGRDGATAGDDGTADASETAVDAVTPQPDWEPAGLRRRPLREWFHAAAWRRALAPAVPRPPAAPSTPAPAVAHDPTAPPTPPLAVPHDPAAPPRPAPPAVAGGLPRHCLLLQDGCGLGEALAAALAAQGWLLTRVEAGPGFQQLAPDHFHIDPGSAADHALLWQLLAAHDALPERILHLWNVTTAGETADGATLDRSFYSLLHLAQNLGRHGSRPAADAAAPQDAGRAVEIVVFSTGLHAVESADRPEPLKAALLGPCRVLPQEQPGVRCRAIDVVLLPAPDAVSPRLIEHCLAELADDAGPPTVACRGPHRWVPSWEPLALDALPAGTLPQALRQGGVYLISGGLGGLGLEVAAYLAQRVQARLVLVGRTALPPQESWQDWLDRHGDSHPLSRKLLRLRQIQDAGAELLLAAADVCDPQQMSAVRALAQARFGTVHGLFHAAGVAGGGLLQTRRPEQAATVLAPKIQGTLTLASVFADAELLVLFSSLTATLGGIGQADYCAANAVLDAFAAARANDDAHGVAATAPRVLAIAWDAWQQVGMAAETDLPDELRAWNDRNLDQAIRPAEGREALDRLLAAAATAHRLAVSTHSFAARRAAAERLRITDLLTHLPPARHHAHHQRPPAAPDYAAPESALEELLAGLWQELLGFAPAGRHDDFFELGGHSLLALQLASRLRQRTTAELALETLFANPTPARLAAALRDAAAQTPPPPATQLLPPSLETRPVALQPDGPRPPLFCIHPAGGTVSCYHDLARRLGPLRPLYAFQSDGLDGSLDEERSIEQLAAAYVASIRAIRPSGPYHVAGWSMGGIVVYEMAQQLQAAGEEIGLVALFDTDAVTRPNSGEPLSEDEAEILFALFGEQLALSREQLRALPAGEPLLEVVRRAQRSGSLPADFTVEQARRLMAVYKRNRRAQWTYLPRPYPGALVLFQAADRRRGGKLGLGWDELVHGGVRTWVMPGTHDNLLMEPRTGAVAEILSGLLAECEAPLRPSRARST